MGDSGDGVDTQTDAGQPGDAAYVFQIRFGVDAADAAVSLSPSSFEATMSRRADLPGEDGWLFFRDNLWRGEVNDPAHLRTLAEEALGVPVEHVEFRELRTDAVYLEALKRAIAADLTLFRAEDVGEVLSKYLGSSVHVRD